MYSKNEFFRPDRLTYSEYWGLRSVPKVEDESKGMRIEEHTFRCYLYLHKFPFLYNRMLMMR